MLHIKTWWIFSLLLVPALLCAQSRLDSFFTPYDSMQDVSVDRMERQWEYQLKQTEEQLMESIRLSDSLAGELDGLKERVGPLEEDNIQLKGRITLLQEQLDKSAGESEIFRGKLKKALWIGGTLAVLLLLSSFLFLLLYSIRTRAMLVSIQSRLKRLRKAIRLQQTELHGIPVMKKKRVRKIAGQEVKSRLRTLQIKKKKK